MNKFEKKNIKKIYIIGSVASGKTTLAKHLSKKLNINYYSLDKIIWDDEEKVKRKSNERDKLFQNIIKNKSWIIEDVGRNYFKKGREKADIIYYISLKKRTIYYRVLTRWLKQKLKLEEYDYQPTIASLIQMFKWAKQYNKEQVLEEYESKLVILTEKDLKKMYKEE